MSAKAYTSDHDRQALRLALALGPARGWALPWPADLQRWLEETWASPSRPAFWRGAGSLDELVATMRRALGRAAEVGARPLFKGEVGYPEAWLRLGGTAPPVVFVRGEVWSQALGGCVAIVGSRAAYSDALRQARAWAQALARKGYTIVSGGALGIDAAAHRGCIDGGGATVAVFGCGIDVCYPERHSDLFEEICARGGGLVSQLPPAAPPRREHFPQRNALVAGLAEAVVVVSARQRSGALNSARWARRLGLPVYAWPESAGCRSLLHSGARPVRDAESLLAALAGEEPPPAEARELSGEQRRVLSVLRRGPRGLDAVAKSCALVPAQAASVLLELELEGLVVTGRDGRFSLTAA